MEIISLSGYTHLEKLAIGRQFLVPKQKQEQGLEDAKIDFQDTAIEELIDSLHARGGRPQPGARSRLGAAQGRAAGA